MVSNGKSLSNAADLVDQIEGIKSDSSGSRNTNMDLADQTIQNVC